MHNFDLALEKRPRSNVNMPIESLMTIITSSVSVIVYEIIIYGYAYFGNIADSIFKFYLQIEGQGRDEQN